MENTTPRKYKVTLYNTAEGHRHETKEMMVLAYDMKEAALMVNAELSRHTRIYNGKIIPCHAIELIEPWVEAKE